MSPTQNLVSGEISREEVQAIVDQIGALRARLSFLITLTPEERTQLPTPGAEVLAALPSLAQAADEHPQHFPEDIFDAKELRRDLALHEALEPIHLAARSLADAVSDTRRAAASDAYRNGLSGWVLTKVAVKSVPAMAAVIGRMREALDRPARRRGAESTPA
jgi:hypothetical protein